MIRYRKTYIKCVTCEGRGWHEWVDRFDFLWIHRKTKKYFGCGNCNNTGFLAHYDEIK